jgi:hypothetical protein
MLWNKLFALTPAILMALNLLATDATAYSLRHGQRHAWRHHYRVYRAPHGPYWGWGFRGYGSVPDGCNLPTNLCPNELRDIP